MIMDTYMRKFKFSLQDHGQITQIAMGEEGGGVLRKNLFADGVQAFIRKKLTLQNKHLKKFNKS